MAGNNGTDNRLLITRTAAILLLITSFVLPVQADDVEPKFQLDWAINPSPPFHIVQGQFEGLGICDTLIEHLIAELPDVEHRVSVLPHSRIRYNVEQEQNLCFPCMIKRDFNPFFVYSDQTTLHPPLGIIMRREMLQTLPLDQNGQISFARLARDEALRFGRPSARRYPPALQNVIDRYTTTARFFELSGSDATVRVMQQILLGRLDYSLEYPSILAYFQRTQEGGDGLVFVATSEFGDQAVPGAIGCTKGEWGAQAIEHINRGLRKVVNDPAYQSSQALWLTVD